MVEAVSLEPSQGSPWIKWAGTSGERRIGVAEGPPTGLFGLTELVDNNPLVCSDRFAVLDAAETLLHIGLAPLLQAGLVTHSISMMTNQEIDQDEAEARLGTLYGLAPDALAVHVEPVDLGSVASATILIPIRTPEDLEEIDALFEECYGRSYFVRRWEDGEWDTKDVAGQPHALYRLRISPEEGTSLLTVLVMADLQGKAGAAQMVHALNIMDGWEETLGIVG